MTYVLFSYLLVFANVNPIVCPRWLPGTNIPLPVGVGLSPGQELQNRVRCYCEVVKKAEADCIRSRNPRRQCIQHTDDWVRQNLQIFIAPDHQVADPPQRNLMINIRTNP